MKKMLKNKKIMIILVFIVFIIMGLSIYLLSDKSEEKNSNSINNESVFEDEFENNQDDVYLVMSINPKIMLLINDNIIIEIYQLNKDADIFLPEEFVDLRLEDGITKIINIARENQFIKEDTIIELSTFTQTLVDDEGNEKIIELSNLVRTKIIEDGINVKPIEMSEEEMTNIFDIVQSIPETNNGVTEEENNNSLHNSGNSSNNNSNENDSSNEEDNINENNSSNDTNDSNNSDEDETQEVKQKLDINKVINTSNFITKDFNIDVSMYKPSGYNSFEEYWGEMINKWNAGTFDDYINSMDCGDSTDEDCYNNKEFLINSYSLSTLTRNRNQYDGNYYKKAMNNFYIGDDGYGGKGLVVSEYARYPLECLHYYISFGGCGGFFNGPIEYTLTSDYDYYYLNFSTSSNGKEVKCTAKNDMIFTCDNLYYEDDKTGQKINVFYPST